MMFFNYSDQIHKEDPDLFEIIYRPTRTNFQGLKQFHPKFKYEMCAPEVLPSDDRSVQLTNSADIWTLGCIIFNMVTGAPPFVEDKYINETPLFEQIRSGNWNQQGKLIFKSESTELIDILE